MNMPLLLTKYAVYADGRRRYDVPPRLLAKRQGRNTSHIILLAKVATTSGLLTEVPYS